MPTNYQIEYSQTESNICPYCHTQIAQQDTAMRCAECDYVYHESCWTALDKCAQFGCEETVAHAVTYRTISGDGNQSRWLSITDQVVTTASVSGFQLPAHLISPPTMAEYRLFCKQALRTPSKILLTVNKLRQARDFYRQRGQLKHFNELLIFSSFIMAIMLCTPVAILYKSIQIGNTGLFDILLWLTMASMLIWLWLMISLYIDRATIKK